MRSRQYVDLTNYEIEQYLKRNDIIIVPVGHCETLGGTPVDGEYVGAHAWANLMAERVDGLVLPNVTYTYAGGTETGRGTIHMNVLDSFKQTLSLAHTLLTQGFRRQVWIPSHGPTKSFLPGMVQQFFIETKVPALYFDPMYYFQKMGLEKPMDFTMKTKPEPIRTKAGEIVEHMDQTLGSYKLCGRLDKFPAKGEVDFPPAEYHTMAENFAPWFMDECEPLFWCTDIVGTPFYFETTRQHGGDPVALFTREEMEARAAIGETYMREIADDARFPELLFGLRKLDKYMQESALPKNADHLPKNRFSPIM